jgi:hypothetical protein
MAIENNDAKNRERELKERADERTIRHETIPGEKTHPSNSDKTSAKEKASHSTADDDLN